MCGLCGSTRWSVRQSGIDAGGFGYVRESLTPKPTPTRLAVVQQENEIMTLDQYLAQVEEQGGDPELCKFHR
jgi:hypothetical protein